MNSTNNIDEIRDDEIRIISPVPKRNDGKKGGSLFIWILAFILIILVAAIIIVATQKGKSEVSTAYELRNAKECVAVHSSMMPIGDYEDNSEIAYAEVLTDTVNDVSFTIYIPHNTTPRLVLKTPDLADKSIVLAAQAADIRADNGKIVGSFVLNGDLLAKGSAKKGFCSIINGAMTIGVSDNTQLFEEAIDKNGYFFRQYPLVDNGVMVDNEPKGKSIRKALCERDGQIMIIISDNIESFHDFAQALADFGVSNAIYLVGSQYSYGFYRDKSGAYTEFSDNRGSQFEMESYIVWEASSGN